MLRVLIIILMMFWNVSSVFCENIQNTGASSIVKETYKLQGQIEYDDNPVEVIYLDENIERPQVNIPKRSLTLPVGVLNITSNTNTPRSALARSHVNRGTLTDILPLSGSISEQFKGFSYGQMWEQEMSNFSQMENTTAFFVRYDTPRLFSLTTSIRQATYQDLGTQYNTLRVAPEWHITEKLTLKDSFTSYMDHSRNKNELTLVYTPALKKYAESLKFELGVAQTYYRTGRQTSGLKFSTGFRL